MLKYPLIPVEPTLKVQHKDSYPTFVMMRWRTTYSLFGSVFKTKNPYDKITKLT